VHILSCGLFLSLALIAGVVDLRTRQIPNWLTVSGALAGLGLAALAGRDPLLQSILGFTVSLLIGFLLFQLRALGAGDAKLLAAFGAWFGLRNLPEAFVAMLGGGALLALFWAWKRGVLRGTLVSTGSILQGGLKVRPWIGDTAAGKFPYGVGLGMGAVAWWLWTGCGSL
jgi:Flp pilus assembly protein protease CpaA